MVKKYEEILSVVNFHEFEMFVGLIILVVVLTYIGTKVRKLIKRIRRARIRTYVALQFTNDESEVIVKVQLFRSMTDDLRLCTESVPERFQLIGWLFPKLQFQWEAVITDRFRHRIHLVKNEITLSWINAILLKRMFKDDQFGVVPVLRSHGKTVMLKQEEDEEEKDVEECNTPQTNGSIPKQRQTEMIEMKEFPAGTLRRQASGRESSRSFKVVKRQTPLLHRKKRELMEMGKAGIV
jgi:hypothetical protein